jgi:Icc-related predicted phosphoesterase
MAKLTKAFKDKKNEILFIAGDLGHYIADGHMPLHTSDNHDGQNTNQNSLVGKSFARVV